MKKIFFSLMALGLCSGAMAQLGAGKYFVKNNESGQFLSNGANWGTRSVLFGRGIEYDVTVGEDGKYTLKSGIKNDNTALRPSDGFNDQSGAWELQATEGGYYMYNGSQYFCNSENGIPGFKDEADASCVWSFVTADERKAALAKATAENPVDATVFIQAADFHNADVKNSAWSKNKVGGEAGFASTLMNSHNCEQWNAGEFTISQTITGLPAGLYSISCQGFTRKAGASVESADSYENGEVLPAYLFAGANKVALKSIFAEADTESKDGWSTVTATSGTQYVIANGQNTAAAKFSEGAYTVTIDNIIVTGDGTLEIGVTSEGGIEWVVFDTFRLTYYGGLSDDALTEAYNEALEAAKAVSGQMNKEVWSNLNGLVDYYENNAPTDKGDYEEATSMLSNAIHDAEASIAVYKQIAAINGEALDASGKEAFAASVTAKYTTGDYTTLDEAEADYRKAVIAQTTPGADFTGAIINPNFNGNIKGWTDTFSAGNHGFQNNATYNNEEEDAHINQFMECWIAQPNKLGNGKLSQAVELPAGEYTMTADIISCFQGEGTAMEELTGVFIFAQSDVIFKSDACQTGNGQPKKYSFTFNTTGGPTELGLLIENTNCNWAAMDNVRLVYKGESTINLFQESLKKDVKDENAKNYNSEVCNAEVLQSYNLAVGEAEGYVEDDQLTKEDYDQLIGNIKEAEKAVLASIEVYKQIAAINEKAAMLNGEAAVAAYAEVLATYNNRTATEVAPFEAAYAAALAVAEPPVALPIDNNDWVGMTGNVADWACPDMPGAPERYKEGAFTGDVMVKTITGLKPGTYTVVLKGAASYTSGRGFEGATGQNRAFFFANEALQSMEVYDRASVPAGQIDEAVLTCGVKEDGVLRMGIVNKTMGANWFVVKLESLAWNSTELPQTTVDMVVTDAMYATFIAPFEVTPEGVTAFTVDTANENWITLTKIETIPANTPVMIYSEEAINKKVSGVSLAESPTYTVGLLTGVYAPVEITEGYILQDHSEYGIGFYKVTSAKTIPANHAYLTAPAAEEGEAAVRGYHFDTETAIKAVEALTAGKAQIFDLNGRKLQKLQKGINIVNGVKVLVK